MFSLIEERHGKILSEFKRTHHENWNQYQKKFTEAQLKILNEILNLPILKVNK